MVGLIANKGLELGELCAAGTDKAAKQVPLEDLALGTRRGSRKIDLLMRVRFIFLYNLSI